MPRKVYIMEKSQNACPHHLPKWIIYASAHPYIAREMAIIYIRTSSGFFCNFPSYTLLIYDQLHDSIYKFELTWSIETAPIGLASRLHKT